MAPSQPSPTLLLPMAVVTHSDVGRLLRETETIINFLDQSEIREPGTSLKLPKSSRLFDQTVDINKLNMLNKQDGAKLKEFLRGIYDNAPVLHASFNTDPSPIFLQKLITWLRQNVHPSLVLQIGLVQNIGAGCLVRTTNKYYDFSLRQRFTESKPVLISKLRGAVEPAVATVQSVTKESTLT